MLKQDVKEFSEIMVGMADNYGRTLTASGLRLRFEALQDYTIDQVTMAATKLLRTHRYNTMPTVGDFVAVLDHAEGKISMSDRAEIEAGEVLAHLRRHGRTLKPRFKDPITSHLMSSRWRYLSWASYVKEADLKWWQKDFISAYNAHEAGTGARAGDYLPAGLKIKRVAQTVKNIQQ